MMSENTINRALVAIGYKGRLVGHGARHTASTLLRKHGWDRDYGEALLAHKGPSVAGIYNQAIHFEQCRKMTR
ncbi:tyrosine-type recombinase/integrase [Zymobacter sp. IVIA_12111.31 C1]|uniref:tyrosine-type recombinase/integrase n=1 Tax=Zymobacter sp. IVIA_12111.31 C1 TaxID=3394854 RepID=UPI0039C2FF28